MTYVTAATPAIGKTRPDGLQPTDCYVSMRLATSET